MNKLVIVLDCGATNVRAIALNQTGQIVAQKAMFNETSKDPKLPEYLIWDTNWIWEKFSTCCQEVVQQLDTDDIVGVTVTTFGVDGAPYDKQGKMLYPVISWKCPRTQAVMEQIAKYIDPEALYKRNGVQPASFNTLYKLIWLKENEPEVFAKMDSFRFIPSIFLHKLSGAVVSDRSMLGTSMLSELQTQEFSTHILDKIGLSVGAFPPLVNAGEKIGTVNTQASTDLGIPEGVPVFAAGHDTQFALFGSGAATNDLVISSGTWEILMARTQSVSTEQLTTQTGVTIEFDAMHGLYNMGCQWLASGLLEWVKNTFYPQYKDTDEVYDVMISQASALSGSPVQFSQDFSFHSDVGGAISGLSINTKPEEIYLASLHYLADKMKQSIQVLEKTADFKATSVICVGGGSKNKLWNQIKANTLGIPIKTINQKETTVLGAALFAFYGAGVYESPEQAREHVQYQTQIYTPE